MASTVSPERLVRADAVLASGIADALYTHAVYALAREGEMIALQAFGQATAFTRFDLASLTKPVATATCLLQLVEQGRLHLRQPVHQFFEDEFGPLPHLSGVEVRHLLTHTSGLPPIPRWPADGAHPSRRDMIQAVLTTPALRPAGTGYTYSDTGYILLGEIIAHIAGQPLEVCFQAGVAGPLDRKTLGFLPKNGPGEAIAPTGPEPPGVVHDPRARDMGGVAGHAGLFGTAEDVLAFAEAIRTGGGPLLSRAATQRMAVSQILPSIGGQSYGWFCPGNDYLPQGDLFSDQSFGHSGFTGTVLLIDPAFDLSLVLLTNRVVNQDEDGSRFLRQRRLWLNVVASALL
jgi:CubicO group peptidase (beta-lactamase class C family)